MEKVEGKLLKLETKNNTDVLVTENPSFDNATHRRTVFFVDKKFFVIVDEGYGKMQKPENQFKFPHT